VQSGRKWTSKSAEGNLVGFGGKGIADLVKLQDANWWSETDRTARAGLSGPLAS
jgi:hypothetical protein